MHVDAGRSMEQLRERVATLRTERDAARDEAKTSAEDKQEADLAWNELVSSLKSEAYVRVFFYLKKKKNQTLLTQQHPTGFFWRHSPAWLVFN